MPNVIEFKNHQGVVVGVMNIVDDVVTFDGNIHESAKVLCAYLNETFLSQYAKKIAVLEQDLLGMRDECNRLQLELARANGDFIG